MSNPALVMPSKAEVERALADSASFVDGVPELFKKYGDRRLRGSLRRVHGADGAV